MRNFALTDEEIRLVTGLRSISKEHRDAIFGAVEILARKHQPGRPARPRKPALSVIRTRK